MLSDDQPNATSAVDQIDGLIVRRTARSETAEFERWLEDRVPGRELAAEFERTTSRIIDDRYIQAVTESDQVLLGEEGWLFLAESALQPCITPAQEAAWMRRDRPERQNPGSDGPASRARHRPGPGDHRARTARRHPQ